MAFVIPAEERFTGWPVSPQTCAIEHALEAIRICVRRHAELSSSQLKFINTIGARDKQLTKEQAARLTAIMEKFRQDDLVSHLDNLPWP